MVTSSPVPVAVLDDLLLLAALADLAQHRVDGRCPDCTLDGECTTLTAAHLTVDALAPEPAA